MFTNRRTTRAFHDSRVLITACAVAGAAALGAPASGQVMADNEWRQGTTLSGFVGGATSPSTGAAPALGLTIGWDLTPRLGIDGRGLWMPSKYGDAFAATLGGRLALQPARPFVPFVSAGAGFHRASFDRPTDPAAGFYRGRMMVPEGRSHGYVFTDFALALGGGADIFVSRHIAVRPDVSVMMVTTRSDVRLVPVYGVHLSYHFESRPMTP
jgi:hypothetical protein